MKLTSLLGAVLCSLFAASGYARPPVPPGPPPPMPSSSESLATIPGVSSAQQIQLRKILIERRDAMEAAHTKARDEFEAAHRRERDQLDQIDAHSADQLRKLLGDDGYRRFAEWEMSRGMPWRTGPHPRRMPPPDMDRGRAPPQRDGADGAPPDSPPPPGAMQH